MKTARRWHTLVLLALVMDLVNPVLPGIFSLVHGALFMDGVTRAHGGLAGASCVRDCPRGRAVADTTRSEPTAGIRTVVRDARRTHEHPDPRRMLSVAAGPRSDDVEDH
jgi:hypothetical protein